MLSAVAHLANNPTGAVLIVIVVAVVLFAVSAVVAVLERAFWAGLVAAGLGFGFLAFLIS
jgi:hypothetical protein